MDLHTQCARKTARCWCALASHGQGAERTSAEGKGSGKPPTVSDYRVAYLGTRAHPSLSSRHPCRRAFELPQPNVSQSGSCAPAKNMHQSKRRAQPQEDQHAQAAEASQWCPRARDALLVVRVSTTPFVSKERVPPPPTGVGPLECVAHRVQAAAPTALGGATRESGRSRRSQAGFTLKRHVGLSCIGYPG
jgi:hypothetical protein